MGGEGFEADEICCNGYRAHTKSDNDLKLIIDVE